jgi:hypothetical protein
MLDTRSLEVKVLQLRRELRQVGKGHAAEVELFEGLGQTTEVFDLVSIRARERSDVGISSRWSILVLLRLRFFSSDGTDGRLARVASPNSSRVLG